MLKYLDGPALVQEIAVPLWRRVGTAISGGLMTWGITTDQAHQAVIAIGTIAGVGWDLWRSHRARKAGKR